MKHPTIHHVPGTPEQSGYTHGRILVDILTRDFIEAYIDRLRRAIPFSRDDLSAQASRWLANLPAQYQQEIAGMGAGSGVGTALVSEFLFADIARSTDDATARNEILAETGEDGAIIAGDGPMCSSLVTRLDDGHAWIARNCDWLIPTLMRGTAAVVHETPNRIPVMAIGIRGDIDVDTGINAEGLWLHLHTLYATDDPPLDRTSISWLFWAREALETCATLDDLERFIESTGRDRGVFAIAGDGKTDEAAIFECTRSSHTRHDVEPSNPACVTNHSLDRDRDDSKPSKGRASGTTARFRALKERLSTYPTRRGPTDLINHLASSGVEMRTPRWIRTIYSAVVRPKDAALWFASGTDKGEPAASRGTWQKITPPWIQK